MAINKEKNVARNITFTKKQWELIQQLADLDCRSANSLVVMMFNEGLRLSTKGKQLMEELKQQEQEEE